jgi:6-phosphogluconolactonase
MKKPGKIITIIFVIATLISCKKEYTLIVGGFTKNEGEKGMSVFNFNSRNGDLKLLSESDVGPSPSYFCFSKKDSLFYVNNEVMQFRGNFGGGLSTFRFDPGTKEFTKLNELLIPYGGPCFISMSSDSGYLFMANYPNGSVAVVKLNDRGVPESITDTILYNKAEPDASHAHMILEDPSGNHVYVSDLGLDRIVTYNFNPGDGKLIEAENGITSVPKGSGPRHFVFNKDGSKLYLINELGSKMMVFDVGKKQSLSLIQTLTTTEEGYNRDNYCADVHISKDGKFLYGSNRGENTIVTFRIEPDGTLSLAGHSTCGGDWPRNFVIDPTGKYILVGNQKSDYISVLKINKETGLPSDTINKVPVKSPVCLKFY